MIIAIDIRPQAKQSARFTRNGHSYQPKRVVDYATQLRCAAISEMKGAPPLTEPVYVWVFASYALPKKSTAADRAIIASGGSVPKSTRPDVDNIMKATLDPLNGIVWRDDALIVEAKVCKRYGEKDSLVIMVKTLKNAQMAQLERR
jgi:Holliday junction resolvase RusA-like endonuclease